MSFDISKMAADQDTFDIELIDPTTDLPLAGEGGKTASVTVYNPGTRKFQVAQAKEENRQFNRFKRKRGGDETPEEKREARAVFLTSVTVSFNNFSYKGMEDGPEAWRACYADPKLGWIPQRVQTELGDWGNSTKSASVD